MPSVVNLKHIFERFGLYTSCFLDLIRVSSDGQFWRKSKNENGGKFELRLQLCYYNCKRFFFLGLLKLESNIRKSVLYCRSSGFVFCLLGFDCSIQNLQKSKGPFEDKGKPHEILIVTTNGRQIRFSQLLHTRDT